MLIYIALTFSMLTADDEWSVQAHLLGLLHNIECFSIANVICPVTIQFRPSYNQTKNPEVIPGIFCIGMAEVV